MRTYTRELYESGKKIMNFDYNNALNIFHKVRDKAMETNDLRLLGEVLLDMCMIYRNISDSVNGFKTCREALKCFEELNDTESLARANNFLGIFYFYTGLFQKALRCFMTAKAAIKDRNCPRLYLSILSNIGEVYKEAANYDYAIAYYKRAEELAKANNIKDYQAMVLSNIGDVHVIKDNLTNALEYYTEAFSLIDPDSNILYSGDLYKKIGIVHLKKMDLDIAKSYLLKAKEAFEKIDNKFYLVETLLKIYDLEKLLGNQEILPILEQARTLASIIGADKKLAEIEKCLHDYYFLINDYKKALEHFTNYHYLVINSDSLNLIQKLEMLKLENEETDKMPPDNILDEIIESQYNESKKIIELLKKQNSMLEKQAYFDTLTDLPNRRSIERKLSSLENPEKGKCHAIMIIDIDHFKWINDGMGHAFGDDCLHKISSILHREVVQANGFVGRYGGEEFLCIIENTDLQAIHDITEQLRYRVENENICYTHKGKQYNVTISIGYTIITDFSDHSIDSYIEKADGALYTAKSLGRNTVIRR